MAKEYLGTGLPDGVTMGRSSTDLISFHDATPSDQYAAVTCATGSTIADAVSAIQSLIALLQEKGLMAT